MRNFWIAAICLLAACGESREFPPIGERYSGAGAQGPVDGEWYRPEPSTTWQWQLSGTVNDSYDVEVYDVDLFDVPASTIATLRADGRKVICYLSAGSFEEWRPDASKFDEIDIGKKLDGWDGERWLDVRSDLVFDIVVARFDLAVEKGCDGVEPDNIDGYTNRTGFALAAEDQAAFNRAIANAAHERGLAIGLKNSGDQAVELEPYFDFELNEQCHEYNECGQLEVFTRAGKPVWNVEYPSKAADAEKLADEVCGAARSENFRTLILPLDLNDAFRISCD